MTDIFSLKDYSFPKDFLWGSAYAGHQVEGNNKNNAYWEREISGEKDDMSGLACNSYEMFRDDINLVKELNHQIFRTSVEWCRIEPEPGVFNEEATNHYIEFFSGLKEKGIKVFATMVHFVTPLWFTNEGGFGNLDNLKHFERFLNYMVPKIAPYVDLWCVLNEFNLMGEVMTSIKFHALGYHIIKKYSDKPVSTAHAMIDAVPMRKYDKLDNIVASYRDFKENEFFLHAIRTGEVIMPYEDGYFDKDIKDSVDFWGMNLYTRKIIDSRKKSPGANPWNYARLEMIPKENFWHEEMYPECMMAAFSRLNDKPIYITENGIAADNDEFRIVYLAEYLSIIADAIKMGYDIRGYLHWSLLDNYEWNDFIPKFGLCSVDREGDFKRTPKPSAYFYRDIINNNGFSQEILRKYLTSMPSLDKTIK